MTERRTVTAVLDALFWGASGMMFICMTLVLWAYPTPAEMPARLFLGLASNGMLMFGILLLLMLTDMIKSWRPGDHATGGRT